MSVIAEFTVSAEHFRLGETLANHPGLRIRLERVVPLGSAIVPYIWVSNTDIGDIIDTLRNEPDIESVDTIDQVNGEALLKITWNQGFDGLVESLVAADGILLEASGTDERWLFQIRFPDHDSLATFYRECHDRDIPLELGQVHNPGLPENPIFGFSLTEAQRETLLAALDAGYFDVPRDTNLVELSEMMGVSDTAVSQRLRRGIVSLLTATLAESSTDGSE